MKTTITTLRQMNEILIARLMPGLIQTTSSDCQWSLTHGIFSSVSTQPSSQDIKTRGYLGMF